MPLLIAPTPITSLQIAPTEPTEGFAVQSVDAAMVTVSELADLSSWTMTHFGLTDDEQGGQSTFPASTTWPEIVNLTKPREASDTILVPLVGVMRWAPRVTAWTTTGGSPTLTPRIRLLRGVNAEQWRFLGHIASFTDIEIDRLIELSGDTNTPRRLDSKFNILAEVADDIDVELQFTDIGGVVDLEQIIRFQVELYDVNMVPFTGLGANFTASVIVGSQSIPASPSPILLGTSTSTGNATIRIHDVVGASSAIIPFKITTTVDIGGLLASFVAFDGV